MGKAIKDMSVAELEAEMEKEDKDTVKAKVLREVYYRRLSE